MSNPVAAGLSRISLLNLSDRTVTERQVVLEIYDGRNRIQVEFEDLDHFEEVIERSPGQMMHYFENHLFDSPEMDDPRDALVSMAATAGDEGLVTVPPEEDDEALFEAMTTIFQKTADLTGTSSEKLNGGSGDGFLQSMVRDAEENDGKGSD